MSKRTAFHLMWFMLCLTTFYAIFLALGVGR